MDELISTININELLSDFLNKYRTNHDINKLLENMFSRASVLDPINGMNKLFIGILRKTNTTIPLNIVKNMIELGADPHYECDEAFYVSCTDNIIDVPLYLIEKYDVDINADENVLNPKCSVVVLKMLLEKGLQITTDLIIKRIHCIESLELFLNYDISLEKIIQCCLNSTLSNSYKNTTNYLIDKIKKNDSYIKPVLLSKFFIDTFKYNNLTIEQIKILIEAGADPRYNNDSAFISSCEQVNNNNLDTTIFFINECGANINAQDSAALEFAIWHNNYQIAKFLIESGINITDRTISISFSINKYYLQLFINNGVDIDRISKLYITDLANKKVQIDIAKDLIKNGVDLNKYFLNY